MQPENSRAAASAPLTVRRWLFYGAFFEMTERSVLLLHCSRNKQTHRRCQRALPAAPKPARESPALSGPPYAGPGGTVMPPPCRRPPSLGERANYLSPAYTRSGRFPPSRFSQSTLARLDQHMDGEIPGRNTPAAKSQTSRNKCGHACRHAREGAYALLIPSFRAKRGRIGPGADSGASWESGRCGRMSRRSYSPLESLFCFFVI
jgi:hypothetical protein